MTLPQSFPLWKLFQDAAAAWWLELNWADPSSSNCNCLPPRRGQHRGANEFNWCVRLGLWLAHRQRWELMSRFYNKPKHQPTKIYCILVSVFYSLIGSCLDCAVRLAISGAAAAHTHFARSPGSSWVTAFLDSMSSVDLGDLWRQRSERWAILNSHGSSDCSWTALGTSAHWHAACVSQVSHFKETCGDL